MSISANLGYGTCVYDVPDYFEVNGKQDFIACMCTQTKHGSCGLGTAGIHSAMGLSNTAAGCQTAYLVVIAHVVSVAGARRPQVLHRVCHAAGHAGLRAVARRRRQVPGGPFFSSAIVHSWDLVSVLPDS